MLKAAMKKRQRNRWRLRLGSEQLESRIVLDSTVVFNEIMYNPAGPDTNTEWIELHNQMAVDVDLTGWRLAGGVEYAFPTGTVLPGGDYLVVAADPLTVQQQDRAIGVVGPYTGRLSNGGEFLELRNHTNRMMNSITYDDQGRWPVAADGGGASLAKFDAQSATEDPQNWTHSDEVGGTPGRENFLENRLIERQAVLPIDATWRYDQTGVDLGTTWRDSSFDDSHWMSGEGVFFAESSFLPAEKKTSIRPDVMTSYFRTTFEIDGSTDKAQIIFKHLIDDGAVFYINGQEVQRFQMPEGPVVFETEASATVSNAAFTETLPVDGTMLRQGTNTLAVEVHQRQLASNDLVFATEMFIQRPRAFPSFDRETFQFHEITPAAADRFWIEMKNIAPYAANVQGLRIESSRGERYSMDALTVESDGYWLLDDTTLGFRPEPGDKLYAYTPDGGRILDAVAVEDHGRGRSDQLAGQWQRTSQETPRETNEFSLHNEIVINEILYHARPTYAVDASTRLQQLLPVDATWRFNQSGRVDASWLDPTFDDSNWASGTGAFYAEKRELPVPKNTPLETGEIAYYFRTQFDVNPQDVQDLVVYHLVDDGAVFYVNGVEFARFRLPQGEITADTVASSSVSRATINGPIEIPAELLVDGANTLAVEVHQRSAGSSDVVFGLEILQQTETSDSSEYAESHEEWIELFNRGEQVVDLEGWRLQGGIDLDMPAGTTLAPGEYAVVTNNAAVVESKHPGVRILGEYEGRLSNNDERIELVDDIGNQADLVHYFDGGYWPEFADGGGVSLELRNPHADNANPVAWSGSDESAKTEWTHYSYQKVASQLVTEPPIHFNEFVMGMLSAGEILIDNISVIQDPNGAAVELISNGSFDQDEIGSQARRWRAVGTHRESRVVADPEDPSNHVLHFIATGRSSYLSNHAETTLVDDTVVLDGKIYQVSFDARWLVGSPQLHTELYYQDAAHTTVVAQPDTTGTPGAPNSVFEDNLGPTLANLSHHPVVPTSTENVVIRVAADDADGIDAMTLYYAVDGIQPFVPILMESGTDGFYTAAIPPHDDRTLVQFYVQATDLRGATSVFPPKGPESRALYRVDDTFVLNPHLPDFQMLMTSHDVSEMHRSVHMMDNNRRGSTIIYEGRHAFYDAGTRFRGSMFSRGGSGGYNIEFRPEQKFRGVHRSIGMDRGTSELFVKFVATQSGNLGGTYDDVFDVQTPSSHGSTRLLIYLSRQGVVQQREQFEDGADGTLFKLEGIRVMQTVSEPGNPESLKLYQPIGWVGAFDIQDLGNDKEKYRWPFLINRNRAKDDYAPIIQMAQAFSLSGAELEQAVGELLDMDVWTHTFALMSLFGIADTYSQGNPHNLNFYVRPSDGKVLAYPWDWDFIFTHTPSAALHGGKNLGRVLNLPRYDRLLQGQMVHLLETVFNRDYLARWADHFGSLLGGNFDSFLESIDKRTRFVRDQLTPSVPFQLDVNPPEIVSEILVNEESDAQAFVPLENNGGHELGTRWTELGFETNDDWSRGVAAVGFDATPNDFVGVIKHDISRMRRQNSSVYIRVPFNVAMDPSPFEILKLRLKYDDGFVAYLNGVPVVTANAPADVQWDSKSTASRLNREAKLFVDFDISKHLDLVKPGGNVLAIHGLNRSKSNDDAVFVPQLLMQRVERTPLLEDLVVNDDTVTITGKAWIDIKHIRLKGSAQALPVAWNETTDWQVTLPLTASRTELTFEAYDFQDRLVSSETVNVATDQFDMAFDGLRISEVHYHPSDPSPTESSAGYDDADAFEFVELANVGQQTIDLSAVALEQVRFEGRQQGVSFDFSSSEFQQLEPGDRVVVVENLNAFRHRYGADTVVAGEWSGGLNNATEMITLTVHGREWIQVTYQDDWYPSTDGAGAALQAIDRPQREVGVVSQPNAWRPSSLDGGTPGRDDVPAGDANRDGVFNYADLVFAMIAGEYNDAVEGNSTWEEGDWNRDGEFNSEDIVFVFRIGAYVF